MINFTPSNLQKKENLDNVVSYIILKKLLLPVQKTDAYTLGIVDSQGKKLRDPETPEEKYAYTTLDNLIFRLKRELGSKLNKLNSFQYVKVFDDDIYKQLNVSGSITKKGVVQKIKKVVQNKMESENIDFEMLLKEMVYDYIKEEN
jgi:hypothetical protein